MNKKEFAVFASAMRTYYPKENILPNEQALELWYRQLKDIPYNVIEVTLNKWVATNKWSPSIAEIREQATSIVQGEVKDWGAAWQEVLRAIRIYGSYRELEALESLDPTTRKVVEQMGFSSLCYSEHIQTDRANFRMIYEQQQERDKLNAQLPPSLKALMSNMTLMLEEKKGGE